VELFLSHHAKVYVRDIDDRTALHEASRWSEKNDEENKNRIDCIRLLLEEDGADINALTIRRESPLMIACRYGTVDLVKYLMENGADLLHTDLQGYNCLEVAIDEKNKSVVEHLLDNDHMFELMRNAQIYREGSRQGTIESNQEGSTNVWQLQMHGRHSDEKVDQKHARDGFESARQMYYDIG
jgi:ankyrin repeat protein